MSNTKQKAQQALAKTRVDTKVVTFKKLVQSQQKSIAAALPKHMDPMRMMRVVVSAAERNPKLFDCSAQSLVKSILEASAMGLEPDGVRGHAFLIPYGNECQLQLGYQGMIELALRSDKVLSVHAEVVYEGEHFLWEEGTAARLVHTPKLDLPSDAKVLCAYAVARLQGGGTVHAVLRERDIHKRRSASKSASSNSSPWKTHYEAMCRKSAVRELAKFLPQSPELQKAAVVDEARDERPEAIEASFDLLGGEGEKPNPGGGAVDATTGEVMSEEEAYVSQGPPEREPGEEG